MSLTLATVRGNVRNHIDEPSANYWTDAELNSYISSRQLDLWRRIYQIDKDYFLSPTGFTLTTAVNQYQYGTADGVPTNIFRIESIRTTTSGFQDTSWVNANPTSQEFLDGLRSDVPVAMPFRILYSLRNVNTIWISPLPQSSLQAQVDYIMLPTAVAADSDTFVMPDPFLDFIEYMATVDALAKGPVGDSVGWLQHAEKAWENIVLALDTPRSNQGPDVVMGMFSSGGGD